MVEKSKSSINSEIKRSEIESYNPRYFQLMQNPEREGELITVSLVDKQAFRVMQEKKQCMEESKSHDFALIECKNEVAIISYWRINAYDRLMCYRQL